MNPTLIVLAQSANDHYQRAFEHFRNAGEILSNPGANGSTSEQWSSMSGSDGMWLLPLIFVIFLLIPKGGGSKSSSAKPATAGVSPLLIIGVVALGAVLLMNGSLG